MEHSDLKYVWKFDVEYLHKVITSVTDQQTCR
jgi:hypothetical protein